MAGQLRQETGTKIVSGRGRKREVGFRRVRGPGRKGEKIFDPKERYETGVWWGRGNHPFVPKSHLSNTKVTCDSITHRKSSVTTRLTDILILSGTGLKTMEEIF